MTTLNYAEFAVARESEPGQSTLTPHALLLSLAGCNNGYLFVCTRAELTVAEAYPELFFIGPGGFPPLNIKIHAQPTAQWEAAREDLHRATLRELARPVEWFVVFGPARVTLAGPFPTRDAARAWPGFDQRRHTTIAEVIA